MSSVKIILPILFYAGLAHAQAPTPALKNELVRVPPKNAIQKLNLEPAQKKNIANQSCSEAVRQICGQAKESEGGIGGCVQLNKEKLSSYCDGKNEKTIPQAQIAEAPKTQSSPEKSKLEISLSAGHNGIKAKQGGFADGDGNYIGLRLKYFDKNWGINPEFSTSNFERGGPDVKRTSIFAHFGPLVVHDITERESNTSHWNYYLFGFGQRFDLGDIATVVVSGGIADTETRLSSSYMDKLHGGYVGANIFADLWKFKIRVRHGQIVIGSENMSATNLRIALFPLTVWGLSLGPEFEYGQVKLLAIDESYSRLGLTLLF